MPLPNSSPGIHMSFLASRKALETRAVGTLRSPPWKRQLLAAFVRAIIAGRRKKASCLSLSPRNPKCVRTAVSALRLDSTFLRTAADQTAIAATICNLEMTQIGGGFVNLKDRTLGLEGLRRHGKDAQCSSRDLLRR